MSITTAQFKTKFSEFSSIPDATIDLIIDEANIFIGSRYGKYEDMCQYYYVAHNLTVQQDQQDGDNSASLTPASESVGNVSTSYSNPTTDNADDAYYMSSSYGQKYLEFRLKALRTFGATTC